MAGKNGQKLNSSIEQTVRSYRQVLGEAGLPIDKILVFGSQAKGTARQWSDVDVAVVSSEFGRDYHNDLLRLLELRENISLAIEPHPMTPEELQDPWSSFASEVRKYGIPVD